jgi:hypothetical protein
VSRYPNIEVDFDDEGRGADVELEDRGEVIDEPFDPTLIDVQVLTPTVNLLLSRFRSGALDLQPDFEGVSVIQRMLMGRPWPA